MLILVTFQPFQAWNCASGGLRHPVGGQFRPFEAPTGFLIPKPYILRIGIKDKITISPTPIIFLA